MKQFNFMRNQGVGRTILVSRLSIVAAIFGIAFVACPLHAKTPGACSILFGNAPSEAFLQAQAAEAGLRVQNYDELFRFDSRTPQEIRSASGFTPNPMKTNGFLLDHVRSRSLGTSRFVSFSQEAENKSLFLEDVFLVESARSNTFPTKQSESEYLSRFNAENLAKLRAEPELIDQRLSELLGRPFDHIWFMKHKSQDYQALSAELKAEFDQLEERRSQATMEYYILSEGPQPPQVLEFLQYRAVNVRGIDTSRIGIAREKEVVTDHVASGNITHVRTVYLIFNGGSPAIPPLEDSFYHATLGYMIGRYPPSVVFGEWSAF